MKDWYKGYVGLNSESKTLRFGLIPQGKTMEYIVERGVITEDEQRDSNYKIVKNVIDNYHKEYISKALRKLEFSDLERYEELYMIPNKTDKEKEEFQKVEQSLRKDVFKALKSGEEFAMLFKKELIRDILPKFVSTEEEYNAVADFANFSTYFTGFFENRKNMYTDEAKTTAIAYRIVNDNLPIFIDNQHILDMLIDNGVLDVIEIEKDLENELNGKTIKEIFSLDNYDKVVRNEDIVVYNVIIGGLNNGKEKIQGINEKVNLYNQNKPLKKMPMLKELKKQILADRETLSVKIEKFEDDQEVLETIRRFSNIVMPVISCIERLLRKVEEYNLNNIYVVNGPAISELSQRVLGDWSLIKTYLEYEYDAANSKKAKNKTEKYLEERRKSIVKKDSFSINELNELVEKYSGENPKFEKYYMMFQVDSVSLCDSARKALKEVENLFETTYTSKKGLPSDKVSVLKLKLYLDAVYEVYSFVKPLLGKGTEPIKDNVFYGELIKEVSVLQDIVPLYNKVRNYVTQKPYSIEKVKLNFNSPTLLNGFDVNKETSNLSVILVKDDKYYLGIMNKKDNKIFEGELPITEPCYKKMDYKLLPGPNKMLPKVFFAESNLDKFKPSEDILNEYKKGSHKLGDTFDLNKCHNLIDFYKTSIQSHEDWNKFEFKFSDTKDYKDISQFYHEVEKQGYKMTFRDVSEEYIDQMVDEGKLYLFQIYNKDFSSYSKGKPNLHTMYWKMLFDERNLQNVIYKLNGEAEVFYRKRSIEDDKKIIHPKNQPVINKNPESKKKESIFEYDLVKDKRYTCDKFQLHIPITMNFCAQSREKINDKVFETIRQNEGINVIGIDRGERNLLYISVINPEGSIIHQESLNIITGDNGYKQDYHRLLDEKEKEMSKARENWMEIKSIKELKEGYLSLAIHKITKLMIEYNAIVVLEDLNFGFKNGRKKVDKQIYQKFEKMLIDKLSYYVDKSKQPEEIGGVLNALQLTDKFESFKKLGKQSGFLFYVPAWNTSKIDPLTGFVNLLDTRYKSVEDTKQFIQTFNSISYNQKENYFEFMLDYNRFNNKAKDSKAIWTVCSYGKRITNVKNKINQWESKEVDITQELIELFEKFNIDYYRDNLIADICNIDKKEFHQVLMKNITLILQIRNSWINTDIDYMISPVKSEDGVFFDTRDWDVIDPNKIPKDADANGAYNIAKKGLWILEQIRNSSDNKIKLAISNSEWLQYAQENVLKNE